MGYDSRAGRGYAAIVKDQAPRRKGKSPRAAYLPPGRACSDSAGSLRWPARQRARFEGGPEADSFHLIALQGAGPTCNEMKRIATNATNRDEPGDPRLAQDDRGLDPE